MAAKIVGKEASIFVPTGNMGNLLSILAHCREKGLEIIVGQESHIAWDENGGPAVKIIHK